jgi:hypothetical protein
MSDCTTDESLTDGGHGRRFYSPRFDPTISGTIVPARSYGKGSLATYRIRGTYKAANRDRWEVSNSETFTG